MTHLHASFHGSDRSPATTLIVVVTALGLAGLAWLAHDPALRGPFVAGTVAAAGGLVVIWRRDALSRREVLVGAVLLRLAFIPLWPELSDDTFRYIWDGWLQADGINPYRFRPEDVSLSADREGALFQRLNSKTYYSVYPPLSQLYFWMAGSLFEGDLWATHYAVKGLFATTEVGGVFLLSRLVSARNLLLYAWNPLVLIETAGQGHTEAAAVAFVVAAVWAVRRGRGHLASVAIAAAGLVKLYPFLLAPLLLRRFRWTVALSGASVIGAACIPYAAGYVIPHVLDSVRLYFNLFEFNAGPYYALKEGLRVVTGEDWSKSLGPFFQTLFLLAVPVVYAVDWVRDWTFRRASIWIVGLFFVLSTTVHPWYLVVVVALAVMGAGPPAWGWLWLGVLSVATYLFYVGGPYWPWVVLGWGGAAGLAGWQLREEGRRLRGLLADGFDRVLQWTQRRRAAEKVHQVLPALEKVQTTLRETAGPPRPAPGALTVLDIGAGEGYVGEEIERRLDANVGLVDVVDMNRTDLAHHVYDGESLPFENASVDVCLLFFVLHHCERPERVLDEALRVSRAGVIVAETVYRSEPQRRLLRVLDRAANRIRSGGAMSGQEKHLAFRCSAEWEAAARALGAQIRWTSTDEGGVHPRRFWWIDRETEGSVIAQPDAGTHQ